MWTISEQTHVEATVAVGLNPRPGCMPKRRCFILPSVPRAPQPQPGLPIAVHSSWGSLDVLPLEVLDLVVADDFLGQSGWGSTSRLNAVSKELYEWVMSSVIVLLPPPGPLPTPQARGWGQAVTSPEWSWVREGCCMLRTDELADWDSDPQIQKPRFPWVHKIGTPCNPGRQRWGTHWGPHRWGPWY
jgi:hypothetical protein